MPLKNGSSIARRLSAQRDSVHLENAIRREARELSELPSKSRLALLKDLKSDHPTFHAMIMAELYTLTVATRLTGDLVIARLDSVSDDDAKARVFEQVATKMWALITEGEAKGRAVCKEILVTLRAKAPGYRLGLQVAINKVYMAPKRWLPPASTLETRPVGFKKKLKALAGARPWQVSVTYDIICSHVFEVKAKNAKEAVAKAEQACYDTDMHQYMSTGHITETVIVGRPDDEKFENPSGQVRSK